MICIRIASVRAGSSFDSGVFEGKPSGSFLAVY